MSQLSRERMRAVTLPPLSPVDITPFASTIAILKKRGVPDRVIAEFFVCERTEVERMGVR